MDIFKFHNPTNPTKFEQGEIINGLTSKLWVERYLETGEFTLVGPASLDLKNLLPLGTFLSHTNTPEVMRVENHEIKEERDKEPQITITGRGFEGAIFEGRVVGSNKNYPVVTTPSDYALAANFTPAQVMQMLSDHLLAANLIDDGNAIDYVTIQSTAPAAGVNEARTIAYADLYKSMIDILSIEKLGVKIVRPGPWSPLGAASPNLAIVIHTGTDRSANVIFSYDTGEIASADYLWSIKGSYNAALVSGRYVETMVTTVQTGVNRRVLFVDASDLDGSFTDPPVGVDLANMIAQMQARGRQELAAANDISLMKADVSKDHVSTSYRTDYFVGDIVTVSGDYNQMEKQRIIEYAEVEDEKGFQGYPTLAAV